MLDPLISFIIPVYNVENYLLKCVNSIIEQNLESYEIILVDDGSTDDSPNICDYFTETYENIYVIHKCNEGQAKARNLGIEISNGKFIFFLDSDDYYIKGKLKKFENMLKNNTEIDLILGKIKISFDKEHSAPKCNYKNFKNIDGFSGEKALDFMIETDQFLVSPYSFIVRKEIVLKNNIRFDESLRCGEDILFTPQIYLYSELVRVVDDYFLMYRKNRPGQLTGKIDIDKLRTVLSILDYWLENIDNFNISDKTKIVFKKFLGNIYLNSLYDIKLLKESEKEKKELLKEYDYLIKFAGGKKYFLIKHIYNLFGFNIAVLAIYVLKKIYRLWLYKK